MKSNLSSSFIANNNDSSQDVKLRELTGHDEQSLIGTKELQPFLRAIYLLERVLVPKKNEADDLRKGPSSLSTSIRDLKVGDRMILILLLRKLNFGNILQCVVICPECNESLSVDFSIDDLIKSDQNKVDLIVRTKLTNNWTGVNVKINHYDLTIRPVTGRDQELLLANRENKYGKYSNLNENYDLGKTNNAQDLVRTCIVSCKPPLPSRVSRKFLLDLSSKLEALDPHAEINIKLNCPSCQYSFQSPFYPEEFVLNEIGLRSRELESEVHWIAFNYHWNEDTILSLPIRKRKVYLNLINKTLAGEPI